MVEFWLGVLGSIIASLIIILATYIYKYIRRGKALDTVLESRRILAEKAWALSQTVLNEEYGEDAATLARATQQAATVGVDQIERGHETCS